MLQPQQQGYCLPPVSPGHPLRSLPAGHSQSSQQSAGHKENRLGCPLTFVGEAKAWGVLLPCLVAARLLQEEAEEERGKGQPVARGSLHPGALRLGRGQLALTAPWSSAEMPPPPPAASREWGRLHHGGLCVGRDPRPLAGEGARGTASDGSAGQLILQKTSGQLPGGEEPPRASVQPPAHPQCCKMSRGCCAACCGGRSQPRRARHAWPGRRGTGWGPCSACHKRLVSVYLSRAPAGCQGAGVHPSLGSAGSGGDKACLEELAQPEPGRESGDPRRRVSRWLGCPRSLGSH